MIADDIAPVTSMYEAGKTASHYIIWLEWVPAVKELL